MHSADNLHIQPSAADDELALRLSLYLCTRNRNPAGMPTENTTVATVTYGRKLYHRSV